MPSVQPSTAAPNEFARELFSGLPSRYDALAELLSFGQNHRWRAAMVDAVVSLEPRPLLRVGGTGGVERQQLEGAEPALVPAVRHPEAVGDLVTSASVHVVVPEDGDEGDPLGQERRQRSQHRMAASARA